MHCFALFLGLIRHSRTLVFCLNLFQHELDWVGRLPESLFLSTSSLCGCLFDNLALHARSFLKQEDRQWLTSMVGGPLGALSRALANHSDNPEQQLEAPEEVAYASLKSLVDRLTETDFIHLPTFIRGLLYILTDCIDSEGGRALTGGLARVAGGPPHPTNNVSAMAVCICSQVVLSRFLASTLQLLRSEVLAAAKGVRPPSPLALPVPINEIGKTAAEVSEAHVQQLFWDRRSLPPISLLDRALRHLGAFCSDIAVSALLLEEDKHRRTKEEEDTVKMLQETKKRLETHPDRRFYAELAVRVTKWMRRQLELPRLHSPLVLCTKQQPQLGESAARNLLEYICSVDAGLKSGTFKPRGGLLPEGLYSPHFEQLVDLALMVSGRPLQNTTGRQGPLSGPL